MQSLKGFLTHIATKRDLARAYKPRGLHSDKYSNGKVIVVGGSESFHGAPVLAAKAADNTLAALRIGAGYAITCVPKSVELAVRKVSPNLVVKALSGRTLVPKDLKALKDAAERADSIVIGPGLGRSKATLYALSKFIDYTCEAGKRIIIDADAIYAIGYTKRLGKNVLITPNRFEFRFLYKHDLNTDNLKFRVNAAIDVAKRLDTNVLLKGHETIVTDGKRYRIIAAKSAALATMGTGDVLAGIIGGFAVNNEDMYTAAVAGAYLQAFIGDALYKKKGAHIIATDVVDAIPGVLKRIS